MATATNKKAKTAQAKKVAEAKKAQKKQVEVWQLNMQNPPEN